MNISVIVLLAAGPALKPGSVSPPHNLELEARSAQRLIDQQYTHRTYPTRVRPPHAQVDPPAWDAKHLRIGDRFPAAYRHRRYVVDDWYEHGLSAPHPGNRWVQHGSDYVMVGTATGTIIELSLDSSDGEDRCDP